MTSLIEKNKKIKVSETDSNKSYYLVCVLCLCTRVFQFVKKNKNKHVIDK